MARDLHDLARSAADAAKALPAAQRVGTQKAALYTTTMIRNQIRAVTGDMRLSGVGKRGAKVGAKYPPIKGTGTTATAFIKATGPIQLIEHPTSAHRIPRARGRGKKRYAVVDGHPYAHANHPGTKPSKPFERGWRKAEPEVPRIYQRGVRTAITKAWK